MEGTLNHPYIALLCIYLGMASGLLYDVVRLISALLGGNRVVQAVCEVVYCLVYAGLCLIIWLVLLDLKLRVFYLLGMALGCGIYCGGIRALLRMLKRKILGFFHKFRRKK